MSAVRIGIEGGRRGLIETAAALGAPVLISANSLWRNGRFCGWRSYSGLDVALDSGGFVAMKRYGGYRWSIEEYVALAKAMRPTWWAQMDFCCEPEIAGNQAVVWRRIDMTARHLQECQRIARAEKVAPPLLVLQGWKPTDYTKGPIYEQDYQWPSLVGVGSVCRRNIHGPDGLLAVISALDKALPVHVQLHLFGVKGAALSHLKGHPRFASMDSMAWSLAARWDSYKTGTSCNGEKRVRFMRDWYLTQTAKLT